MSHHRHYGNQSYDAAQILEDARVVASKQNYYTITNQYHMCATHHHNPGSWLIDKPRTTVAWSKFASSCFCLPGFQQLARGAGRTDEAAPPQSSLDEYCLHYNISHHHHSHGTFVSDMSESETSSCTSLSEDENHETTRDRRVPPPLPPRKNSNPNHFIHSSNLNRARASTAPDRVVTSGKPPIPLYRPQAVPLWTNSASRGNSHNSKNNRSFVTTGSSVSTTSSYISSYKTSDDNFSGRDSSARGAGSSSLASGSVGSRHRRNSPIHYDRSYEACLHEIPPPPSLCQEYPLVVGRNRLDSEISALEIESEACCEHQHKDDDDGDGDSTVGSDSEENSPFPLLRLKGEGRALISSLKVVDTRGNKIFQPDSRPPRIQGQNHPKRGGNNNENGTTINKRQRQSRPSQEIQKYEKHLCVRKPTDFLCKNSTLENRLLRLRLPKACREEERTRAVVSGWIVVLFGERATASSSNTNKNRLPSQQLSEFFAEDLYYLRIVEDSSSVSSGGAPSSALMVLHRSDDGSQEYSFPIERNWSIESIELQDRRVGRSISIRRTCNRPGSVTADAADVEDCIKMIPVALNNSCLSKLDQRIQESARVATTNENANANANRHGSQPSKPPKHVPIPKKEPSDSSTSIFALPRHGRFAPDAQLDTARHLFFTIDSFAKRHC